MTQAEPGADLRRGHGRCDVEALKLMAAKTLQKCDLFGAFDPFGQWLQPQLLGHGDDRERNTLQPAVAVDLGHKDAVDLENRDGGIEDGRNRGMRGAEIIKCQRKPASRSL